MDSEKHSSLFCRSVSDEEKKVLIAMTSDCVVQMFQLLLKRVLLTFQALRTLKKS